MCFNEGAKNVFFEKTELNRGVHIYMTTIMITFFSVKYRIFSRTHRSQFGRYLHDFFCNNLLYPSRFAYFSEKSFNVPPSFRKIDFEIGEF